MSILLHGKMAFLFGDALVFDNLHPWVVRQLSVLDIGKESPDALGVFAFVPICKG
jgi:hypothetical protein